MAGRAALARAYLYFVVAYLAAFGAAYAVTLWLGPSAAPLRVIAWADAAATLVVFAFSVGVNNSSVYDPYWTAAPPVIAAYLALRPESSAAPLARQILVITLVTLWALRLTYNWVAGFQGLGHEDWRYVDFRHKTRAFYWPVSLVALHFFPTVMVYLGCLPLEPALASQHALGPLDAVAALVTLGGIVLEATADAQLRAFRRSKKAPGEMMERGLWAWSRHPNYLGEMLFWWGLFLFAIAVDPGAWKTGAGALAITLMFVAGTIPMMEARSRKNRPEYAGLEKRVSMVFPWPPRKKAGD